MTHSAAVRAARSFLNGEVSLLDDMSAKRICEALDELSMRTYAWRPWRLSVEDAVSSAPPRFYIARTGVDGEEFFGGAKHVTSDAVMAAHTLNLANREAYADEVLCRPSPE